MFIPIGFDKEEVRRTPYVSYGILLANGTIFLVAVFAFLWSTWPPTGLLGTILIVVFGPLPVGAYGFVPAQADVLHSLMSTFVHASLLHLAGNMLFFYLTGPFVEDRYGRTFFLFFYLSAGVAADFVDAAHDPEILVPRVGASGAIAGVMGAFLIHFFRRRVRFLWMPLFPFPWWSRQFYVPVFLYLPFWFLCQYGLAVVSADSGIGYWDHVGGFFFGFFVALVVWITRAERWILRPSIEAQVSYRPPEELLQAVDAGRRGNFREARRATSRVLAAQPENADAARLAYELALEFGDREETGRAAARLLEVYQKLGERELAARLVLEMTAGGLSSVSSRFLLRAADFLAAEGEAPRALELYEFVRENRSDTLALRAFLKAEDIVRNRNTTMA